MDSVRRKSWLPAKLLTLLLLVGAQSGALAHVFEHDAGTPQFQACASCVTANQLDSSCIDTLTETDGGDRHSCQPVNDATTLASLQAPAARQRGPPDPL